MVVSRSGSRIIAWAPAKLNLFFEVLGRREDGFHEIETLMAAVSLYDRLVLEPIPQAAAGPDRAVELDCRWAIADGDARFGPLPAPSENLVTRALLRFRERSGSAFGARVWLDKSIPPAAGLGGGSSDAAAALLAANLAWEVNWPLDRLASLAAEVGSDVPFFLGAPAAICRGRGERVAPVGQLPQMWFVIVRPPEGLSTAAVYAGVRPALRPRSVEPLAAALRSGDRRGLRQLLHNGLEPAAAQLSPWIGRLHREFQQLGCLAEQMSGSGSSYFGVCPSARHARRTANRLASRGLGSVYAVCT